MPEVTRSFALEWLQDYGDKLYAYAFARVGGDAALAEDLLQETLLAGLKGYGSFQQNAKVDTWLIGILRRKIVDHYRRSGRREREISLDTYFSTSGHLKQMGPWDDDAGQLLQQREFLEVLDGCLGQLSAPLAEAFMVSVMDGLNTEETCRLLDITPTNLSVRLHRARLALRQCLELKWFGGK